MYHHILLAIALQKWGFYSEHALVARDIAMTLALGASKRLHVLSVYHDDEDDGPPDDIDVSQETATSHGEGMKQGMDQLMAQRMEAYVAPLTDAGLQVDTILQVGDPQEIIEHTARRLPADLLILGGHSRRGVVNMALGRIAKRLRRHAPCPLLFVLPTPAKATRIKKMDTADH